MKELRIFALGEILTHFVQYYPTITKLDRHSHSSRRKCEYFLFFRLVTEYLYRKELMARREVLILKYLHILHALEF